jgi:hypothetical protein
MREVTGSTPGLDFYLLCEPIYVSLRLTSLKLLLLCRAGKILMALNWD